MLWRALRLPRYVQELEHNLICTGRRRSLQTGLTPPSEIIDGQLTHSTPAIRSIARSEILAPFSRAAQLFRNPKEIPESARKGEIKIGGIIRSVRKQKYASFAHISDGSTLAPIQVLLEPKLAAGLTNGAFVEVRGRWQLSPAQGQSHELLASTVKIHGPSDPEIYPVQKKYHTNEFLRTIPHLRLRRTFNSLLMRARAQLLSNITEFSSRCTTGFPPALQVHPPLITSSDCEGAGEVFTVVPRGDGNTTLSSKTKEQHYFKDPKYLTVSSQLHLEAFSAELGNVWALSPTFRAEKSDTSRHLSEFYMYEAELRGVENLQAVMLTVQNGIKWLMTQLRSSNSGKELLEFYANRQKHPDEEDVDLSDRWNRLIYGDWTTISYTASIAELEKAYAANPSIFQHAPMWQKGLQLEHEKWIVANPGQGRPTFITDYPKAIKPFYMLPSKIGGDEGKVETVACFDLLFPLGYCEIAGGSLREHRLANLIQNMRERGLLGMKSTGSTTPDLTETASSPAANYPFLEPGEDLGNLRWYADLRRYGSNPHGGFGMGFDRLLAYMTGVSNVRDVVPFPRTWGRADC